MTQWMVRCHHLEVVDPFPNLRLAFGVKFQERCQIRGVWFGNNIARLVTIEHRSKKEPCLSFRTEGSGFEDQWNCAAQR